MKLLSHAIWLMLGLAAMPRLGWAESAPPPPEPDKVDLVIVIDEATLTEAVRTRLVQALPQFIDGSRYGEFARSLHVAVLGTNVGTGSFDTCGPGTGGAFQAVPRGDCSGPDGSFIIDEIDAYGQVTRNYTGELADTVACILPAPGQGCAFSQPMAALQAALQGTVSENDGFLRGDAVLAILVVTGADDCSASDVALFDPANVDTLGPLTPFRCFEHGVTCDRAIDRQAGTYESCTTWSDSQYVRDPQGVVTFLSDLKQDRSQVVVHVLAGPATSGPDGTGTVAPVEVGLDGDGNPQVLPACDSAGASAIPATRLSWLAAQFNGGATSPLCADQYGEALENLDRAIDDALRGEPPPPPPPPGPRPDAGQAVVDAGEGDPGDAKGCGGCSARSDDSAGNAAGLLLGLALLAYLTRRRPAR